MTVEKRSLGSSGMKVAPLALGGNVFGWTADEETSFRILDAFVDAGGNMIDTADVYSAWVPGHQGGESETVIGRWLKRDSSKREKVIIATKVGFLGGQIVDGEYVASLEPKALRSACEASLGRLGIDTIDLYYQHKDNEAVPLADSLGAMDQVAREGKIRSIGLSQFEPARLTEAVKTAEAHGIMRPSVLQTWYNMVSREKLEGPLRDAALAAGMGIVPFYGLANGFLTGKYRSKEDLDKSVRGLRNVEYLEGRGMQVLQALDEVAAETGAPLAAVALAWTNAQPGISATLASATKLEQLDELIASMHLKLTDDQLARLSKVSAAEVPA